MTSQPAVKNNSKEFKLKKFRIGFEVGARGRKDHPLLTLKEDIETKAKNLCKNGNDIRISQEALSKMMETITTETPNLQATIEGLTVVEKVRLETLVGNVLQKSLSAFMQGRDVTKDDIKEPMDKICDFLSIDEHTQANAWNAFHDPKYFNVLMVLSYAPKLIKNNVTIDELNQALHETMGSIIDVTLRTNNIGSPFNFNVVSTDYVNWDLFANLFVNYALTDEFYFIAGIGFNYDLENKKGHSFYGRDYEKARKDRFIDADHEFSFYHTKYAITPRIGWGRQLIRRFAIEVTAYDQITKVEYDCSSMYTKYPIVKMMQSYFPGITAICHNKKQSNWVNIFGLETAFKFNITKNFFTKLGTFFTCDCNIFKKIQPFDLNSYSFGVGLSFGYTF